MHTGYSAEKQTDEIKTIMYGHWYDYNGMLGGGMILAWLWMVVLLVIPLLAIFLLLKYYFGSNLKERLRGEMKGMPAPLDILKASYARGEINREEFLQKRDDILEK